MAEAKARAQYIRVSPRKMRLVADLIRGRKVADARDILDFTVKGAAPVLKKVLDSAVANAESKAAETRDRVDTDEMVISRLLVDSSWTFKRVQPRARARRCLIRKRLSQVELVISDS